MVLHRNYLSIAIVASSIFLILIFLRGAIIWVDFNENTIKGGAGENSNKSIHESKINGQYIVSYRPFGATKCEMQVYNLFIGDVWAEYNSFPLYAAYIKGPINYYDLNEISVKYNFKQSKVKNLTFTHFKTIYNITQYYIHRKKYFHDIIDDTILLNDKSIFLLMEPHNSENYSYIEVAKNSGLFIYKHFFRISLNDSLFKQIQQNEEFIGYNVNYQKYMGDDISKFVPSHFLIELTVAEDNSNKETTIKTYKYKMKCVYPIEYKKLTYNPLTFFVNERKYWGKSQ